MVHYLDLRSHPPCLGDFFPESMVTVMEESEAQTAELVAGGPIAAAVAATVAKFADRCGNHVFQIVHGGGPCGATGDRDRPRLWAHLGRRFRGVWSNLSHSPNSNSSQAPPSKAVMDDSGSRTSSDRKSVV